MFKSGYIGQCDFKKGALVKRSSPEAAGELMKKLKERFGQTTPAAIADEAFTGTDKYLNGVCVFRKGRDIGGFADLKPGRDWVAESMKLSANIKRQRRHGFYQFFLRGICAWRF